MKIQTHMYSKKKKKKNYVQFICVFILVLNFAIRNLYS